MPIQIQCPNGHRLRLKDEYAGKKLRCPKCQAIIAVPQAQVGSTIDWDEVMKEADAGQPLAPLPPARPVATRQGAGESKRRPLLLIVGVTAAVTAILMIGLFFLLRPDRDADSPPGGQEVAQERAKTTGASQDEVREEPGMRKEEPPKSDPSKEERESETTSNHPAAPATVVPSPQAPPLADAIASRTVSEVVRLQPGDPEPADRLRREDISAYELKAAGEGDPAKAPVELVAVIGDSRLKGSISKLTFSPDGGLLASEGSDIRLWDTATGQLERVLPSAIGMFRDIEFHPNGRYLAFVGGIPDEAQEVIGAESFRHVVLWNVESGRLQRVMEGAQGDFLWPKCIAYSPDRQTLAIGGENGSPARRKERWAGNQATSSKEPIGLIHLVHAETGIKKRAFAVQEGIVTSLQFTNDGRTLVSRNQLQKPGFAFRGGGVKLWNWEEGNLEQAITLEGFIPAGMHGVPTLVVNPRDETVAVSAHVPVSNANPGLPTYNAIKLWDVRENREIRTIEFVAESKNEPSRQWIRTVESLAFSHDGKLLAATYSESPSLKSFVESSESSHSVQLWDVDTGTLRQTLQWNRPWAAGLDARSFTPDNKTLAVYGEDGITLWNIESGQQSIPPKDRRLDFRDVSFTPDGTKLALVGYDEISIRDVGTLKQIRTLERDRYSAFSPDGATVAVQTTSGIKLHDLTSQETAADQAAATVTIPLSENLAYSQNVGAACFSPDGRYFVKSPRHGGEAPIEVYDAATGERQMTIPSTSVDHIAVCPKNRHLAVSYVQQEVSVIDLTTGKVRHTLSGSMAPVAFTADGSRIITSAFENIRNSTHVDFVWNVDTGELDEKIEGKRFCTMQLSPDGNTVAIIGDDGVSLWDFTKRALMKKLTIPGGTILRLAFSPTGRHLATVNGNGTVYVLRLQPGRGNPASTQRDATTGANLKRTVPASD